MGTSYKNSVFVELLQNTNHTIISPNEIQNEGIVTSVNDFMKLLVEANKIYNTTFNVAEDNQLIFAEDFPKELFSKLNNNAVASDITSSTLKDIRIVTYLAAEEPGIISSHTINGEGIRNIKSRFNCVYDDPEYTGYSILRSIKSINVNITFKVWGNYFQDIRQRSKLLRDVIDTNIWYFKHKGLREIIWLGSIEEEIWDGKNIAKFKNEKYKLTITEVKEIREKNIEQIVIQMGTQE